MEERRYFRNDDASRSSYKLEQNHNILDSVPAPTNCRKEIIMTEVTTESQIDEMERTPSTPSPWMQYEDRRIHNAKMRDRKFQEERYLKDLPAHMIIDDYRRAATSKEQTIFLLHIHCARSRETALLNLQMSGADDAHREHLKELGMDEKMLLILEGRA